MYILVESNESAMSKETTFAWSKCWQVVGARENWISNKAGPQPLTPSRHTLGPPSLRPLWAGTQNNQSASHSNSAFISALLPRPFCLVQSAPNSFWVSRWVETGTSDLLVSWPWDARGVGNGITFWTCVAPSRGNPWWWRGEEEEEENPRSWLSLSF